MATKTLTDKLESSRVLIFNSRDEEVATLLNEMGIDTAYIDEGCLINGSLLVENVAE